MRRNKILLVSLLAILMAAPAAPCQVSSSDIPVIIRDTDIAEGVEHEEPPKELNPAEAEKNIGVGNFYYKNKNYVGAIGRYLTALEYQPDSTKAYEVFMKAYESLLETTVESPDPTETFQQAIGFIRDYLQNNPNSTRREEFNEKIKQLREKAAKFTY